MKYLLFLSLVFLSSCSFDEAEDSGDIFINHKPFIPEIFFSVNSHPEVTRDKTINIITSSSSELTHMSITNDCSTISWQTYESNITYALNEGVQNTIALRMKMGEYLTSCQEINIFQDNSAEAINNLEVINRDANSIYLGWTEPLSENSITDYQVQYKLTSSSTWTTFDDGTSSDNSLGITSLDPETLYDIRVRSYNGNYSAWSNIIQEETLPDLEFFQDIYRAINVGGATANQIVSLENGNQITIKDVSLATDNNIILNKGETYNFTAEQFDEVVAQAPFYVAGRLGNIGAGAGDKANVTWLTSSWVGKTFYINLTRNEPLSLKVFAFQNANISIYKAGVLQSSHTVDANQGDNISIATQGSYEIVSDGFILAYAHATQYTDPRPLLPASVDIIGFPSAKAMVTSSTDNNPITIIHSNSTEDSLNISRGTTYEISPQGTSSLYQSNALRILSNDVIIANSNADSNGYCSAPFVPVSMLKNNFAINVDADYIAFASNEEATITITFPDTTTQTITLTRSGSNEEAPYFGRITNPPAGTIMESTTKYQAWYQPNSDTFGADEDETILFGW